MSAAELCQQAHYSDNKSARGLTYIQSGDMSQELVKIFADLGLAQYVDAFIDQGFDAWDTILDIQESDLDALGVKLGHRRKLQRRIANARGIAPSISLASSTTPGVDDAKSEGIKKDSPRTDGSAENNGVAKRKYRRHPKPDENAPERPPSAYVLFSNKMREDLKSQNLTFTEIAKLVGENWQSLQPAEKDVYESQANAAKEKYHRELAEYKKTLEYRKYSQYLHDFKERQARQNKGQESSKRAKVEPARLRHGSTSSSATPNGTISSGSGSISESLPGGDLTSNRRDRVDSVASIAGSQPSSTAPTPMSMVNGHEDPGPSPRSLHFENGSPTDFYPSHSRHTSNVQGRSRGDSMHQQLPPLADMLDGRQSRLVTSDSVPFTASPSNASPVIRASGDCSSVFGTGQGHPSLHREQSSSSTNGSGSSASSISRSGEGPLPIHALLSDRDVVTRPDVEKYPKPLYAGAGAVVDEQKPMRGLVQRPRGYGFQSELSAFQNMKFEQSSEGDVVMTTDEPTPVLAGQPSTKNGFDGMNALLRAGEIVGQNSRR